MGSIPGCGISPGGSHSNPLQCSCLENPMDRGSWRAVVHRITKRQTHTEVTQHACVHTCALHACVCTEGFWAPMYEVDKTGYHWREQLGVSDEEKIPQLFFYALLYYPNFYYEPVSFKTQVTSYGKTQVNFLANPIYIFKCGDFNFLSYIYICQLSVFNHVSFIIRKWNSKMLQPVTLNEIHCIDIYLKTSSVQIYFMYHKHPFFSMFTALCNQHDNLILEHFHHLQKKPHTHQQSLPIPYLHTHNSGQPLIHSLSMYLPILDIAYKWNYGTHDVLWLASFTECAFKVYSCCAWISMSFLWVHNIPLSGYLLSFLLIYPLYLSVHQLVDILAVFTLGLL